MILIMSQNETELSCFFYTAGLLCYIKLLYESTYHPKCRNCILRNLANVKTCGFLITLIYLTRFQRLRRYVVLYSFMKHYAEKVKQTLCLNCLR
jgi:hypothetical protein